MKHARGLHIVRAFASVRKQGTLVALAVTSPGMVHAANATWTASSNGAWDTSSNWSTGAAASGASSTATFGSASGTGISINTAITIGTLRFNSGAPSYSLAVNSNASLTLGASGIVNNSSNPLNLTVNASARVNFEGSSTAGNSILFLNSGGIIDFSRSTGTITAGSLAGSTSTNIYLGSRTLTVGSLNSSTLFQGIIADGGNSGATGGSLTKVGAGTLTLDRANTYTGTTTISAGALQIGNGGSNGSILGNVVNNASLIFNRGGTYTFAGNISGTGKVTKSGGGTVTLSGSNTYAGGTQLNAGSLQVSADNNLGNASGALTFNGGTLLYGAGFSSARNVSLSGAGTFNTSTFSSLLSGVISGSGALTKSGSGTLTLTGNNTYTGNTTVSGGTLQIGNGGTTGMLGGNIVNNGILAFNRSNDFAFGGNISGTGSLVKDGAGTLTLTGTLSYAGTTTVLGGALLIGTGGTGGGLEGDLIINSELTFNRADDYLYGGVISGTGSLKKMGAGKLTFTGANLYTGGTTISQGTLQLGNGGTSGSIVGPVTLAGGALAFNRSDYVTFDGALSGTGSITKLGAGTLVLSGPSTFTGTTSVLAGTLRGTTQSLRGTIVNDGAVYFDQSSAGVYSGSISGSGALTKQGGKLTLTGANTYTGATSFVGEVDLTGSGASLNGTSGISLAPTASFANATFRVQDASVVTPGALVVGDMGTAWFHLSGSGTAHTGNAVLGANAGSNGTALIASTSPTGWVNTGTLVVGAAGAGVLTIENNATLSSGSIVLSQLAGSSGTLNIGLGSSAATLNTSSVTGGAGNTGLVSFYTNDPAYTFATVLAGNLRVEQRGSGMTTLTGANTYTGGTTIRGGKLSVASDSNLGDSSGGLTFDGGTLTMNGFASARAVTLGAGGGTIDTGTATSALLGPISGAGSLTVKGNGQLILTGANTYTGSTTIGSTVYVNAGVINGTSGITLAAAPATSSSLLLTHSLSTVRTTGSMTVGHAGAGTLNVTSGSLLTSADGMLGLSAGSSGTATVTGSGSLWSNDGTLTIGGSGSGALTVSDGGVVSANSITLGDLAGSSGVLNFGTGDAAGVINTATITAGAGASAVVNFNHSDTNYTVATQLGGDLSVNHIGPGTTILTGASNYTGLTTISGGTLQIGNGGTTGSIVGDILNNGILLFNRSDDFTFGGAISGTGSLIKDGAGTLTLTGSVTYSGTTTVLGGALLIGTGGTSGNWDGDLNINSTVTFNRSDDLTYAHVVSGTGSVVKLGTGTLTYTNANTYTGGTTISVGTLQVGNGGTTGSLVGNITNNANLAFNRVDDLTFGGVIAGTGALTKRGAGTLTLTGANSYGGGTSITAGTLQVGAGGTSGSISGNVSNSGALVFNRSDALNYAGAVSGAGTFSTLGTGTLNLTGNNTYTGATTLAGTVNVVSGGKIEGTSAIAVAPAASQSGSLRVSGTDSRVTTAGTITVGGLGSGALTIDDGGSVSAASIILGAETGSTGALNLGSGAAAGFLNAATVVDGAGVGSAVNLDFTDSSYTLASNLLHTLTVNQNGSGTTVLTGVNSYTGGTHLNAGTLRVSSNSNLGGAASALYFNGGTLQWGATVTNLPRSIILESGGGTIDTGTFNVTSTGVISGAGHLTKTGSGILALTGANTYSGNVTVSAGTLRGTTNSLKGNILNNGAVEFLQTASGTYSGVISGSGSLTKLNAGNLTLSGANSYTGTTSASSGTLTINGSVSSPVVVGASGTLAGTGTIHGNVSVTGILAPGTAATAPFGTFTVNGNLAFGPTSVLRVQTDELGNNGKINVTGGTHSVTIDGGTVEVMTGGGEYSPHTEYTLITAAGGVTGAFDSVTTDFAFLEPSLSYDANHVNLALDRNDLAFGAFAQRAMASPGAVAAAEYLDEVSGGAGIDTLVRSLTMLNATQATDAFEDLSGGSLAEMSRVSMANTARLFEMLASRLGAKDASAGTGLAFSTLKTGGPRALASRETSEAGSGLWMRQFASERGTTDPSRDAGGVHTAMGLDAALSTDTVLGVSAVYTRDNVDLDDGRTRRSRIRTPQLMAYVSHRLDGADLRGIVGCGRHRYDTERAISVGASATVASARHGAEECSAYAQAEIGSGESPTPLRPIIGVLYSRLKEPRYVETGGAAALAVADHSTESVLANAGVRYARASSDERVSFEARAVWSHEFAAIDSAFRASLADAEGAGQFMVRGAGRARDSVVLGTGVAAELRRGFSFHGDYNVRIDAEHKASHAFIAAFKYVH